MNWFTWSLLSAFFAGATAVVGVATGGEADDPGDREAGVRRAGDGDHDHREPAARRPECDGAGAGIREVVAGVPVDAGLDRDQDGEGPHDGVELHEAVEAADGGAIGD